jgi:acetyl-CoA C-acetyltransferase
MSDPSRIPVLVSGARTPIGRFLGGLSPLSATELGTLAVKAAVERSGIDPAAIDEVILGNVVQAGGGPGARATGGHRRGASRLDPGRDRQQGLRVGTQGGHAGGAGHPGRRPPGGGGGGLRVHVQRAAPPRRAPNRGQVRRPDELRDGLIHDGLWCAFGQCHMGGHAEYTATRRPGSPARRRRLRPGLPPEGHGRHRGRKVRGRDRSGGDRRAARGTVTVDTDEGPAPIPLSRRWVACGPPSRTMPPPRWRTSSSPPGTRRG